MKKYYLHDGVQQQGPFDINELKSKNISKNSQIWCDGILDWMHAWKIPELSELINSTPPVFNKQTTNFSGNQLQHNRIIESNATKNNSSFGKKLLTFLAAVVLILVGLYVYSQLQNNNTVQNKETLQTIVDRQKEQVRNNISSYVTVGSSSYNYRLIGGISNLSLIVTNNSGYMLDDVKVKLSYIKADGTLWKDIDVDFTYVEGNHNMTIKIPDTDRGISIKYQIVSIKSTSLGL